MTRTYALRRLLEHGPMTLAEIVDCTGWRWATAKNALDALLDQHLIRRAGTKTELDFMTKRHVWTYQYEAAIHE